VVEGIHTNIAFHRRIVNHADFRSGAFDTGFVGRLLTSAKV
jgi:biotin carboxylase